MKPYPSYKNSGVKWMGDIPSGWEKKRNKDVLLETKHIVKDSWKDHELLSLTKKGIILRDIESGIGKFPSSFETYQAVEKGDLVFCPYDIEETPRTVGISNLCGMITSSYKILKCKPQIHPKFIFYIYLTLDSFKGLRPHYTGLRNVVRTETFMSLPIYVPNYSEQKQIVSFLDHKTRLIDELIGKTEQKIGLLKEKRTSLINHCVTKGLNPNVEMKDSGVEWIGEIPGHWDSIPIKYTFEKNRESIRTGPFGSQLKSDDMVDEGIKIYNQRTVYDEDFTKGEIYVTPKRYDTMKGFTVLNGDILISSRGTIGKMAIVPDGAEIGVLHPCLIRLRVDTDYLYKRYLWWYMNHSSLFLESVKYESNSTTIDVIYSNVLTEIRFPLPSLREQQQMVEYLDHKIQKVDSTIKKETERIELLREYRQSLISEVVTGKIDMREEVVV